MRRRERLQQIIQAVGDRELVWFGIRGRDAETLLTIPQFRSCFSITAPLEAGKLEDSASMEELTGHRVDLDAYDIDFDSRPEVGQLRRRILSRLCRPAVVLTYRPSHFLTEAHFASIPRSSCLGMVKDRQNAFEHKPWVETELVAAGVRTIPWRYVARDHLTAIERLVAEGPMIMRPSRTSGGEGVVLITERDDVEAMWPHPDEHFVCVAPYLDRALPLNVGAVVWRDGTVSIHPASFQLIGIEGCTTRRFGYCGNDFAAIKALPYDLLEQIDSAVNSIGRWLWTAGYIGAFGVDFLLDDDTLYFAEVNARLQGSSAVSSVLAEGLEFPGVILDHLAATLELSSPSVRMSVADWTGAIDASSQVIIHSTVDVSVRLVEEVIPSRLGRLELAPRAPIRVDPGGVVARLLLEEQVTEDGFTLSSAVSEMVDSVRAALRPATETGNARDT